MTTTAYTRLRTVNGIEWGYDEAEGFWWALDEHFRVGRSDRNCNVWELVNADFDTVIDEFGTCKAAMEYLQRAITRP